MGTNINIELGVYEGSAQRSHLYRYYVARGFVDPEDIVIDYGCGYGYGTYLISQKAKKVIGIDKDQEAIKYATENYKLPNNYFMVGNLDQMETVPLSDVAVCVEVFEHLRYPESFAGKIMQTTRKKIFLSVPIRPTTKEDHTHLHDFEEYQIMEMFGTDGWKNIDGAIQGIHLLTAFSK